MNTANPRARAPFRGRARTWFVLTWLVAILGTGLLAGCAGPSDPTQPPDIHYGEDSCARCGMIVSDPAYAAAYRTAGGETRLFDDVGEMFQHHRERHEEVVSFFVHDYETREWLRAEDAYYVSSRNLRTPMGSGIAALASESKARALAESQGGSVLTFKEALEQARLPDMH